MHEVMVEGKGAQIGKSMERSLRLAQAFLTTKQWSHMAEAGHCIYTQPGGHRLGMSWDGKQGVWDRK
jgi:hypothetical protein